LNGLNGERVVDVNIFMSAHGNASAIYEQRKQLCGKLERTKQAYQEAIKSAHEKIKRALKEHSAAANRVKLQKSRKTFWFERFAWFISSDNYLVLGGKDAQQNELLVKRYMRPQDAYVHAEISGAASVIVCNHLDYDLPQRTLTEAGNLAVCMSRAWEAKIVVGAWWVKPEQVSKTAPSGEYLGTGSFMIRGQKHFLPPATLQLGFGFLCYTEDDALVLRTSLCGRRHPRRRRRRCKHDEAV
jgi:predicted ribosome quality control (RQC) complex YloA/Tae2 family protein